MLKVLLVLKVFKGLNPSVCFRCTCATKRNMGFTSFKSFNSFEILKILKSLKLPIPFFLHHWNSTRGQSPRRVCVCMCVCVSVCVFRCTTEDSTRGQSPRRVCLCVCHMRFIVGNPCVYVCVCLCVCIDINRSSSCRPASH